MKARGVIASAALCLSLGAVTMVATTTQTGCTPSQARTAQTVLDVVGDGAVAACLIANAYLPDPTVQALCRIDAAIWPGVKAWLDKFFQSMEGDAGAGTAEALGGALERYRAKHRAAMAPTPLPMPTPAIFDAGAPEASAPMTAPADAGLAGKRALK